MYKVYGIPNCDTVKKALNWLKTREIDFVFHNYKTEGISSKQLKQRSKEVGWETLLNKKGTTWRQLDEAIKSSVTNQTKAIELMKEKTSLIKRPVIEEDGRIVVVGFSEESYRTLF